MLFSESLYCSECHFAIDMLSHLVLAANRCLCEWILTWQRNVGIKRIFLSRGQHLDDLGGANAAGFALGPALVQSFVA
jgi:hypothetical protein